MSSGSAGTPYRRLSPSRPSLRDFARDDAAGTHPSALQALRGEGIGKDAPPSPRRPKPRRARRSGFLVLGWALTVAWGRGSVVASSVRGLAGAGGGVRHDGAGLRPTGPRRRPGPRRPAPCSAQLRIDFIAVGQGDATLVTSPTGKTVLIDGGPKQAAAGADRRSCAPERGADPSRARSTHPHADHLGGSARRWSETFAVRMFMDAPLPAPEPGLRAAAEDARGARCPGERRPSAAAPSTSAAVQR